MEDLISEAIFDLDSSQIDLEQLITTADTSKYPASKVELERSEGMLGLKQRAASQWIIGDVLRASQAVHVPLPFGTQISL